MVSTSKRTGFTTDTADVAFEILYTGELLPMWEQPSYTSEEHIPGGNVNILFLMGLGSLSVTWTLELATPQDYAALAAMVQTTGTLCIPQPVAERFGFERDLAGVIYSEYSDVTLLSLSRPGAAVDGVVEVQATFWRDGRE